MHKPETVRRENILNCEILPRASKDIDFEFLVCTKGPNLFLANLPHYLTPLFVQTAHRQTTLNTIIE